MAWIYLIAAGLFEVVWAYTLKQSQSFTRLIPSLITIVAMMASFGLLALAMRSLPLGTAYTIWTGIGAIGAFLLGIVFLGEPLTLTRVIAAIFILVGLILMKLSSAS
ncbi:MAG TPA: multidrug efflux SMR transporter [Fibrella sp.]